MELIRAEHIGKIYGKGELTVEALRDINFTIEQGYFYAIIGKSGSGKSTLLHILGALDRPTSGKLYLEGESVFDKKDDEIALLRRRRIGFVFQAYNLLPEHTVEENIRMPVELDGKQVDQAYLQEIVEILGLTEKLSYYPDELSGGQQQRVAIARALIAKPALILADEPTGNLDPVTGAEVLTLLRQSAERFHQTVILVTHDMEIAAQADRRIEIVSTD